MRAAFGWVGGKSKLAKRIVQLMPAHTCYCEVFCGAAWVFFERAPSRVEVINDINLELVTLYRVWQSHPEEFQRCLGSPPYARAEFERYLKTPPATLTDIQRAVRFYYLLNTTYSADLSSPSFGYATDSPQRPMAFDQKFLRDLTGRLSGAVIENCHYAEVLRRYDRPHTLFYLDPPYWDCENDYGADLFSKEDFLRLAEMLTSIKGKFILSINDTPGIRDCFREFEVVEVTTKYSRGSADRGSAVKELIFKNFSTQDTFFG